MFDIDDAAYSKGKQMYAQGHPARAIIAEMKREHDALETSQGRGDWRAAQARANGMMLGFIDGALDDFRRLVGGVRGGLRA